MDILWMHRKISLPSKRPSKMAKPALLNIGLFYTGYLVSYLLKRFWYVPVKKTTLWYTYSNNCFHLLEERESFKHLTSTKARTTFLSTSGNRTGENVNVLIWSQVYRVSLKIFKFKDF